MKKFEKIVEKQEWRGMVPFLIRRTVRGKRWERVKFRELDSYQHNFIDCQFLHCAFEHCRIGESVSCENCLWENCSFSGQYASLGSPAEYMNCRFIDTSFKNGIWANIKFKSCTFSVKFVNVYWQGRWADSGKVKLQFSDCDMRGATFKNVTIKNGLDLSGIHLPSYGIRLLRNNNNDFATALFEAAETCQPETAISLRVMAEFALNQVPVLYDYEHLDHHPGIMGTNAREAFERVAKKFELPIS